MKTITRDEAAAIRRRYYWPRIAAGLLPDEEPDPDEPGFPTKTQLAAAYGVSVNTIARVLRYEFHTGVPRRRGPHRRPHLNAQERDEACRRYAAGEPAGRIAADLGCTRQAVWWTARQAAGRKDVP